MVRYAISRVNFPVACLHEQSRPWIYGHYPVIDGPNTTYYPHLIHEFSFTALNGKEKWTAYKFTKNIYNVWMPKQLQRICSAIDQIPPDVNFEVSGSELRFTEALGLSHDIGSFSAGSNSLDDRRSSDVQNSSITPATSVAEEVTFERPRRESRRKRTGQVCNSQIQMCAFVLLCLWMIEKLPCLTYRDNLVVAFLMQAERPNPSHIVPSVHYGDIPLQPFSNSVALHKSMTNS